jgi:signal transduction histidine kinase
MRTIGVYLIFAAVALRGIVMFIGEPQFPALVLFLMLYGVLLFFESWSIRNKSFKLFQSPAGQISYLVLQSVLVIGLLAISTWEDYFALLFIPLSLDAVAFFGQRVGFLCIGSFSLLLTMALLFADEGPAFGFAMGMLYSGMCFLFGGYAHQVLKAEAAHDQNQHMFAELQATYRQLQGYADQVSNLAIEHERNRLARDLHDSVTQTAFSMNLTVQSARVLLQMEPSRVAGQLIHLEELAANALSEIQSLVSQLRPRSIVEERLPTALRRLSQEHESRDGLHVSLEIHGAGNLSGAETEALYSIAHEALTNIVKHSGVCEATVSLNLDAPDSCLEIADQGVGFAPHLTAEQQGHMGIVGMSERAHEIGWNLCIESEPGQGTRIRVSRNSAGDSA